MVSKIHNFYLDHTNDNNDKIKHTHEYTEEENKNHHQWSKIANYKLRNRGRKT